MAKSTQKTICDLQMTLEGLPVSFSRSVTVVLSVNDDKPFYTSSAVTSGPTVFLNDGIYVYFSFPSTDSLRIRVRDTDTGELLGTASVPLCTVAVASEPTSVTLSIADMTDHATATLRLVPAQRHGSLALTINATEIVNIRKLLSGVMKLRADIIAVDRVTGQSAGYITSTDIVHASSTATWAPALVPLPSLGLIARPHQLMIKIVDVHKDGHTVPLGSATVDSLPILNRGAALAATLVSPTTGAKAASISVECTEMTLTPSLVQYVSAGCSCEPYFFIDMGAGAGTPTAAGSPHAPEGPMELTIGAACEVLAPVNPTGEVRLIAYGGYTGAAKDGEPLPAAHAALDVAEPGAYVDLDCTVTERPPARTTAAPATAYMALREVARLWAPSRATPALRVAVQRAEALAAETVAKRDSDCGDAQTAKFVVAVFFATGEFVDRDAFMRLACQACARGLPISVHVIGVGDRTDFTTLATYFARQSTAMPISKHMAPSAIAAVETAIRVPKREGFLTFTEPLDVRSGGPLALATRAMTSLDNVVAENFWNMKVIV